MPPLEFGRTVKIMTSAPTEIWVRNAEYSIREMLEVGMSNIAWDFGFLIKKSIDPTRFGDLYFPAHTDWKMLAIGRSDQGALEIRRGFSLERPYAHHPVWEYGEDINRLIDHLSLGRLVVITQVPSVSTGPGKKFIRLLDDLQYDYPDGTIHLHGFYSFSVMFGLGFKSVDIDVRTAAQKGKVYLPSGSEVKYEAALSAPEWVTMLGMAPSDLLVPRNRCMYNFRSAIWASKNFKASDKFRHRFSRDANADAAEAADQVEFSDKGASNIFFNRKAKAKEYDKFICNTCSLQLSCRYFRKGAVCAVPDSEPSELARYFKTRDSETIIDGLGTLLAAQTRRLNTAMQEEEELGMLNPQVTKIINDLFDRGVKLAKLVDPKLAAAGATKIQFNQNTINASTPQALMSAVVTELEGRGVPREKITPDMVESLLGMGEDERNNAIQAKAIEAASGHSEA